MSTVPVRTTRAATPADPLSSWFSALLPSLVIAGAGALRVGSGLYSGEALDPTLAVLSALVALSLLVLVGAGAHAVVGLLALATETWRSGR